MIKLVSYDSSSDDADCSSENGELEENGIVEDEKIVRSTVEHLITSVSGDSGGGVQFRDDRKGNSLSIFRRETNNPTNEAAKIVRRKRNRDAMKGKGKEKMRSSTGTDWSDTDSWSNDSSSTSSSDDGDDRRSANFPTKRDVIGQKTQNSDHEFSEDSDYVYAKIVLESRRKPKVYTGTGRLKGPPKTKGELDIQNLPPIEDLHISVPEKAEIRRVGVVTSIVDKLVVIQSDYGVPPLDEETWLVNENKEHLGQVFEIFGPVPRPFYSIRFNKSEDAQNLTSVGGLAYYLPNDEGGTFTRTVFADALRRMKGSDASWEDNNEPPQEALEFSDDEEEKRWRATQKDARRATMIDAASSGSAADCSSSVNDTTDPTFGASASGTTNSRPKATPRRNWNRGGGGGGRGRGRGGIRFSGPQFPPNPVTQNPWASFQQTTGGGSPAYFSPAPRYPTPSSPLFRAPFPPPRFPVQSASVVQRSPHFQQQQQGGWSAQGDRGGNHQSAFRPPAVFTDRRYMQTK